MKRLEELTVEDLRASPVWRYEGGTGPAAFIEPAKRDSLSQVDDEIFLAATEFELQDSSRYLGFCFPADDSSIDYLQPVIVSPQGHVNFWFDEPAAPEVLSRQWKALGREPELVFPVEFRCLVPVDGRTVHGRIQGIESPHDWTRSLVAGESPERPPENRNRDAAGETKADPGAGKRTSRRRKAEIPVQFSQGPLEGTGVIGDLSRRGMFVRSKQIPGTGPLLRLTVNLPGGRKLVLKGRVVRRAGTSSPAAAAPGFGLRLVEEWPEYDQLFPKRRDDND
jgi:hypothetical protein